MQKKLDKMEEVKEEPQNSRLEASCEHSHQKVQIDPQNQSISWVVKNSGACNWPQENLVFKKLFSSGMINTPDTTPVQVGMKPGESMNFKLNFKDF